VLETAIARNSRPAKAVSLCRDGRCTICAHRAQLMSRAKVPTDHCERAMGHIMAACAET